MAQQAQNVVITGLQTLHLFAPVSGIYDLAGKMTLPEIYEGNSAASQVVASVTQNGTTVYTGLAGADGFRLPLNCVIGDNIAVTLSSSAPVDQPINAVKCVISFG